MEYQEIDNLIDDLILKDIYDTSDRTKAHKRLSKIDKDDLITYIIMKKAEEQRSLN